MWECKSVISALRRWKQADQEFKDSLDFIASLRPHSETHETRTITSENKTECNRVRCNASTQEAEGRRISSRSKLAWATKGHPAFKTVQMK